MFIKNVITASLLIIAGAFTTNATTMSYYDLNAPVGFGENVTGGSGGTNITVNNATDLETYLAKDGKYTIYVKGAITVRKMIKVTISNKTIIGLPGSYLTNPNRTTADSTGILYFKSGDNVIMRNMTFKSAGAYDCDGNDNFCIDGMTNVWVDHCDFQDGVDGNFDCKNASDNICVTWCRFHYLISPLAGGSGGSDDHRFTDLWGSSDSATQDIDHLNTTFMFCWWDEGCVERMPRIRYGKVHILNCLYSSTVSNYCIGGGINADVYVDRSAFYNITDGNPYKQIKSGNGAICKFDNCLFNNCSGNQTGTGTSFTPTYTINGSVSSENVKCIVESTYGAGASLTTTESNGVDVDRETSGDCGAVDTTKTDTTGSDTTKTDTTGSDTTKTDTTESSTEIVDCSTIWDLTSNEYASISATSCVNKLYGTPTAVSGNVKIDKIANGGYLKFILKAGLSGVVTVKAINGSSSSTRPIFVTSLEANASVPSASTSSDQAGDPLPTTSDNSEEQTRTVTINKSENNQAIYIYNDGGAVKYYYLSFTTENASNKIIESSLVENNLTIWTNDNFVTIKANNPQNLKVYDIKGFVLLSKQLKSDEEIRLYLKSGIYIANGKKFIVK